MTDTVTEDDVRTLAAMRFEAIPLPEDANKAADPEALRYADWLTRVAMTMLSWPQEELLEKYAEDGETMRETGKLMAEQAKRFEGDAEILLTVVSRIGVVGAQHVMDVTEGSGGNA